MSTQVATTSQSNVPARSIRTLLESESYKGRFQQLLGERAPQFISSLIQIAGNYNMRDCDPNSIIASAMTAAALDLPIDKNLGFAHIVPYKKVAQFQMGAKGYIQLGLRTGQYQRLNSTEIYEGELISHDRVRGDVVIDPAKKKSNKVVGYVAYMRLVNGYEQFEYWTVEEVEAHARKYSKAYGSDYETPWKTNFDAMALKTVIKSLLSHWGILSVQMQKALAADQGVQVTVDSEIQYPDNDPAGIAGAEPAKLVYGKPEVKDAEEVKPKETTKEPAKQEIPPGIDYTTLSRPDMDKLIAEWMERDGVTNEQIVAWAKAGKLCGAKIEEPSQFRDDIALLVLNKWAEILPSIKAAKV